MVRKGMVFLLLVVAWHYTYQNFGSFSVPQTTARDAGGSRQANVPDRASPLLKVAYVGSHTKPGREETASPSLWSQWLATLRNGVAISPLLTHPERAPLTLANITPQAITVLVQNELYRVGCFRGAIDGVWSRQTRRALARFARESAGSDLYASFARPPARPDLRMLTILRQATGRVCRSTCAGGATPTADGRCPVRKARARPSADGLAGADVTARVDASHPAFLPRRNPDRQLARPRIKTRATRGQTTVRLQLPLPRRKLPTQKTALARY